MVKRTGIILCLIAAALIQPCMGNAQSQRDINSEVEQLKQRLSDLEKKLNDQHNTSSQVTTAYKNAKAKIDGRMFIGTFKTGSQGPDPNWSMDIPDAKLRFTFIPSDKITIVTRLSASGAKVGDFDYFYLDYTGIFNPTNILRLGQRKIDFGQETWVDNPVENILISNSVSHISGYGIGAAMLGRFSKDAMAPIYEIGFVNGPKGVTTRPGSGLPVNIKVGAPFTGKLFASASYFATGKLNGADKSAISVAEISDAPTGAVNWKRTIWELDLRYNYGPTGVRPIIPSGSSIPRVMAGATWGKWNDDTTGASDRDGSYWFVECLYNWNSRLYSAARYSNVGLNDDDLAKLGKSPVAVNEYNRTSVGLGYRLTDLTDIKLEYTVNNTNGADSEPSLNQWAVGIAAKF